MEKEKFKALAKDMLPIINDMIAVLEKHEVEKLAGITADKNGYFTFTVHDGMWNIHRVDADHNIKLTKYGGTDRIDEVFE